MRSQNIQKDLNLIGDELIEKFILKDNKTSKYVNSFFSDKNILSHSKNKSDQFTDYQRKILIEELTLQYSKVETSNQTSRNIKLLSNSKTLSVTTGHQLNIFSGPLMVIYKIAQVISVTNYLNLNIKGFNYVPIFWIASEDHDFEEIRSFNYNNENIIWNSDQKGEVGKFSTSNLKSTLDIFSKLLPKNINSEKSV